MTVPDSLSPTLFLTRLRDHLGRTGWTLIDQDRRSVVLGTRRAPDIVVALPSEPDASAGLAWLEDALRAVAFAEGRSVQELLNDLAFAGGADTISLRLTPEDVPSGSAPLGMVRQAVNSLRDLVVGSAAALESRDLVLPPRRPARAENYAERALISTSPGSFVVQVTLPRLELPGVPTSPEATQPQLVAVPPQPYGQRVVTRIRQVTSRASALADRVGAGDERLRAFATPDGASANATELASLAALGGPEPGRYQLRFAQAPEPEIDHQPVLLTVTPAQQRVFADAAKFLRERTPRSGVTVTGLVVRLHRDGHFGPGDIVVQAPSDDTGTERRFSMEVTEGDYNEAMRAHAEGLQVSATGDVEVAGTRTSLRRLTHFAVVPGLI